MRLQEIIAELLKQYAYTNRLTQRQLAEKLGREVSYINKVLRAEVNLTLQTIEDFQNKLDMPLLGYPIWRGQIRQGFRKAIDDSELYNYAYCLLC